MRGLDESKDSSQNSGFASPGASVEGQDGKQRGWSVISISSARNAKESNGGHLPAGANVPRQESVTRGRGNSLVIDLCSEEEGSMTAESPERQVEETPEIGEVVNLHGQQSRVSKDDELRQPAKRGVKRKVYIVSDDNELCEEKDGNAWQRASLRQTQAKKLTFDEQWRNWE